jgi:hypothetical protein
MSKHLVIPDPQVRAGIPLDHLSWLGEYIVAKQPDTVICLGDWADMPSLSVYDPKGSKRFENRRYKKDIEASHAGMWLLLDPMHKYNKSARKKYKPRMVMLGGNHDEGRIATAINKDPALLDGVISLADLGYEEAGWEYVPFLQPINIDGIMYCHYFPTGKMGLPCTSARMLLSKMHMSCIAGHQQGRDIAYGARADGSTITAIIAGSFYQHDEEYMSPLSNKYWRGFYVLHEVNNGSFDEMAVSINYLKRKYS